MKIKDLQKLEAIITRLKSNVYCEPFDIRILESIYKTYNDKRIAINNKSKQYMQEKRKTNKNYGNHYTYKNGKKR